MNATSENEMQGTNTILGTVLTRARDRVMDFRLGVRTNGLTPIPLPGSQESVTLPYADIMEILSAARLKPTDIFIDIGCGRGRVLCCAALFHVHEVIGIEHSPEMCMLAEKNAARLRGDHSPIRILNASATEYDFQDGSVFYMYNPFKSDSILDQVLKRIRDSLERRPRPITIIYANPLHESSLSASSWLKMVDRWEPGNGRRLAVPVSFWRRNE